MILHTKDIRAWDSFTIANEPIASVNLMERAARTLGKALLSLLQPQQRILVFCGSGNNGGDGVALAVMLFRLGYTVSVCYVQDPAAGSDDFTHWHDRFSKMEGPVVQKAEWKSHAWDVLVDAILGTGLNRPLEGSLKDFVAEVNAIQAHKIAVDTPTGLLCNQWGNSENTVFQVHETFTFQVYKWAFVNPENLQYTGKVTLLDIGLLPRFQPSSIPGQLLRANYFQHQPSWIRSQTGEKANFGNTLIIGGDIGMVGAAVFAAKAAVRCGSGWTQVAVPNTAISAIQSLLPEATAVSWSDLDEKKLQKPSTVVLGPGLGKTREASEIVDRVLTHRKAPLILDADALNIIAENQWQHRIPEDTVITPHEREFQRLFGQFGCQEERLVMQQVHSKKLGIYVVYKGPYSTISTPKGSLYFNSSGNAALAKAGSGDVLSGMLGGLCSRLPNWQDAVPLAVYLHGTLADLWVETQSSESLDPPEGIALISQAIKALFPNLDLK